MTANGSPICARRRGRRACTLPTIAAHIESAHDYCKIALRLGRYGPLIHRPGMHDKYALSLDQAAAAIRDYES